MQRKRTLPITIFVGLLVVGFVAVLLTFGPTIRVPASADANPAPVVLLAAEAGLEGTFAGEVQLYWGLTGVLSDTLKTPTPTPTTVGNSYPYTDSMVAELGSMDLGLLIQQSGTNITAYVDLDNTLVFSKEHTIQATPVGPTPFPGTPAPGATPLAVGPKLTGSFDGTTLDLRSEEMVLNVAGKTGVKQQFHLTGTVDRQPNLITLTGEYRETIWNYMPQPVTVIGNFTIHQAVFLQTPDDTPTPTPTSTPVTPGASTHTPTPTATITPTATQTPTSTPSPLPGSTNTPTPTSTPTATPTTQSSSGATVTGLVYDDQNGNGSQESGEPGIAGAEVTLTDGSRSPELTRTAITNVGGVYTLDDVPVGQYTLQVKLPAGQGGSNPPPVQVTVSGKDTVTVPSVAAQVKRTLYLPSINR
ncbi:MAG: MSCRAMM family adhesin SdrC [Caldilineaceae bacterium]|nr:MSCRAMM family adhesin SdrC [Caldilineaceae bacterium]HRJ40755.1 SdrD B-like domain-containing protein [Caldilineaceae bacterium]